jgi:hypothetical protein
MALLLTGVDDLQGKAHPENESVHLGELEKCCVNEAIPLGHQAVGIRSATVRRTQAAAEHTSCCVWRPVNGDLGNAISALMASI